MFKVDSPSGVTITTDGCCQENSAEIAIFGSRIAIDLLATFQDFEVSVLSVRRWIENGALRRMRQSLQILGRADLSLMTQLALTTHPMRGISQEILLVTRAQLSHQDTTVTKFSYLAFRQSADVA
jgi:hypothetical protein